MPGKEESPAQFDPDTVSNALGTVGQPTTDLAFGAGQRYDLATGHLSLEVFPTSRLNRITTPTSRIELFAAPPPRVVNGQVIFDRETGHEDVRLSVSPDGSMIFGYVYSPTEPDSPATPAPLRDTSSAALPAETETPPPPAVTPTGARVPTGRTAGTPEQDQAPRVQLTGRLGRDPSFRTTTKTGTLVGRFPLAEHAEDGTTRWHTVLAFGDRAKQLQRRTQAGELAQGREVDVIGYLHTNTRPGKGGRPRPVQEVYATAVTRH